MQADFAWAGGVSLQRIAWFKAIALLASAELSWFMLPAFCTAFGAIIGAFVGRQLLVAVFVVAIALAYQCLSNRLWVAALFSVPAVLIALSPLLSSHFVLGKKNV
jgi:hypothetical protein